MISHGEAFSRDGSGGKWPVVHTDSSSGVDKQISDQRLVEEMGEGNQRETGMDKLSATSETHMTESDSDRRMVQGLYLRQPGGHPVSVIVLSIRMFKAGLTNFGETPQYSDIFLFNKLCASLFDRFDRPRFPSTLRTKGEEKYSLF